MNKAILIGRITSDIETFGNDNNVTVLTLVTKGAPVKKDGEIVKNEQGYTETYDQFHTVKAFGPLGRSLAEHKKKGDQIAVTGEIRYSKNERDGKTYHNTEIIASEIQFL